MIWKFLSYFGDPSFWLGFLFSFLLFYLFLEKKSREKVKWVMLFLLPTIIISYISVFFLKEIFKVERICIGESHCPETYAFPSGHATVIFAFFATIFIVFRKNPKIYLPFLLLAILVSYSRIALGVHTISDIVGGALLGLTVAFSWYIFFSRVLESRRKKYNLRKILHLCSFVIIPLYFLLPSIYLISFLSLISVLYLISEAFRLKGLYFPVFNEITKAFRKEDEKGFVYSPLLFSTPLIILLFLPKEVFLAGSIALIIGDGFAGLIGTKFGKHKLIYNRDKSIEGTFAFFASSFLFYLPFFNLMESLILAFSGSIIESFLKKTENLILPLSVGILSTLL